MQILFYPYNHKCNEQQLPLYFVLKSNQNNQNQCSRPIIHRFFQRLTKGIPLYREKVKLRLNCLEQGFLLSVVGMAHQQAQCYMPYFGLRDQR